jgi:hypothetical protein
MSPNKYRINISIWQSSSSPQWPSAQPEINVCREQPTKPAFQPNSTTCLALLMPSLDVTKAAMTLTMKCENLTAGPRMPMA